ncbi:TlpA disulfide reductase family protein [Mucilaginibacter sp.]|uniref:TlpA disulfide reductase family protein n=1 Tax=Mucilaginibacter sp. TaxID=1882438 RepID=UPI00261A571F|nr:TlpA disulfide reductase family protein [Mucilaginibacter sp.]
MKTIKIGCTLMALLLLQHAFAQETNSGKQFTLSGQIIGAVIDSVLLNYRDANGKYMQTATPVLNQKFTVSGNIVNHPGSAIMWFKNKGEVISRQQLEDRRHVIYLEPKKMTLTGNPFGKAGIQISGSKTQSEFDELNKELAAVMAERQPVVDELMKEKDHEKQAKIREKLEPFNNRVKKINYHFFLMHPNSYVTSDRIKYDISSLRLDSIKTVYNNFNAELKETDDAKQLAIEIKKIESGMPGSVAAAFTANDLNDKPLSLADFKGKYVIIDFWASWCVPCRKGNPHLIALYSKYHEKGLDIISVSDDDRNHQAWKDAVAKDNIGIWHHVLRGLDMQLIIKHLLNPKDINEKYGIHTLPTKIMIDPSGKIIGRYGDSMGGTDEDMDKMLAEIFKS